MYKMYSLLLVFIHSFETVLRQSRHLLHLEFYITVMFIISSFPFHLYFFILPPVQFSRSVVPNSAWTVACQASLSFTIPWSLLKLMSIESMMPSNHLILSRPLLFLPSVFLSIRVFSSESAFHIRWSKY